MLKTAFLLLMTIALVMINYTGASECEINEVRMKCAPNSMCRTCGMDMCTKECRINACICKEGYRYGRDQQCIPENEC